MKTLHVLCVLMILTAIPLFAGPMGIYYGGSVGQSFIQTKVGDIGEKDLKLDGNDFAWKAYAGVRMAPSFGIEGGFRQLGSVKSKKNDTTYLSKTSGYDLSAVGTISLGVIDVFAKGGAFWWDQEIEDRRGKDTIGGTNFTWGFGAAVHFGGLGVRADWERFELAEFDQLSMLSVGVVLGL